MPTHYEVPETYSDADMLAFVRQAIVEIAACGQSYAVPGGRQWTGANLAELHAMEERYQLKVDSADQGRVFNTARIRTR